MYISSQSCSSAKRRLSFSLDVVPWLEFPANIFQNVCFNLKVFGEKGSEDIISD